jgi:hypothetical protein
VHDSEGEDEIDAPVEPIELHGMRARDACVNSIGEIRVGGPAFEPLDHLGLDIYSDDVACTPDATSEFKREEPHSGVWLKNRHPLVQIWRENNGGIMPQTADRAEEEISEPPGTYAMMMRFSGRCGALLSVSSHRVHAISWELTTLSIRNTASRLGWYVALAAFFMQSQPPAFAMLEVIANLRGDGCADPSEAVDHRADERTVPQPD